MGGTSIGRFSIIVICNQGEDVKKLYPKAILLLFLGMRIMSLE